MKHQPDKKCLGLFARLSEYLDGELSRRDCGAIRKHLEGCNNCQGFLRTLEKTVELCRQYPGEEVPSPVKSKARAELLAAYRAGLARRKKLGRRPGR